MWRMALTDKERKYYLDFSDECRKEYKRLHMEFRATGHYTPSDKFERCDGVGLWVHKRPEEKNHLEREIATYDTVIFPQRPDHMDEDYERRLKESKERRKARMKAEREAKKKSNPLKRKSSSEGEEIGH